jgi:hypothetical protein
MMRKWLSLLAALMTGLAAAACAGERIQGAGLAVPPKDPGGSYYALLHAWTHCYNYGALLASNCISDLASRAERSGGGTPWLRQGTTWNSWHCLRCKDPRLVTNARDALSAGDNVIVTLTGVNTRLPARSEYTRAVTNLLRAVDRTSYTGTLAIEGWNEPDCNCAAEGINSFRAAQYFQDVQHAIDQSGFHNVIPVAGAFVTANSGTETTKCDDKAARPGSSEYINSYACYLYNHGDRGVTHWSFHDYVDTETPNCNVDGSWSGCRADELARFEATIRDTGEAPRPNIYITETGCAFWPSGALGCANGFASLAQSASAGEEFEYLSALASAVIWYTVGYDGNSGWDSAMLNSDGTARPEWCVLDGYSYSEATSSPHCTVSTANGHGHYGI